MADFDQAYRDAVMFVRRRVEIEGKDWAVACRDALEEHTLGVCQVADLYRQAEKRYPPVNADARDNEDVGTVDSEKET